MVWESVPTSVSGNACSLAIDLAQLDHAGQELQVDLVHDARARGHDPQVRERGLRPAQQLVALRVALVLPVDVERERAGRAVLVDLDGVVDDQVRGHQRVDARGVAAEGRHRVAHRGEVHDRGHAREVLEDDARGQERHLGLARAARAPRGQGPHVVLGDDVAARMPEHVLEQDLDRHRGPVEVRETRPVEAVDDQVAVADAQRRARRERVGMGAGLHRSGLHGPRHDWARLGRRLTGVPVSGRAISIDAADDTPRVRGSRDVPSCRHGTRARFRA